MARLATRSWGINERRPTTYSTSGGLSVSEVTERRWTRSSLACWRLDARTERPVHPLSEAALPLEAVTLGGRGGWSGVREGITVGPKVPSTLGGRRVSEGDGEVTVARSEVDADMSTSEAGTDGGGAFSSSGFIVQGWGAGCSPGSAGLGTRVVTVFDHSGVPSMSRCGATGRVVHSLGVV